VIVPVARFFLLVVALWTSAIVQVRAQPVGESAEAWEGLSQLVRAGEQIGIDVRAPTELELGQLEPADALVIVGPEQALPIGSITSFLREGGRVGLLDDVGTGDRLLAAYQVTRATVPTSGVPALRRDPSLLVAFAASEHPLVQDVPLLLTNRAVQLYHPDLKPVFTFGRTSHALLLAGAVGAGRLVAVGDASLVINQMMAIAEHRRFAQNLLRYLARPDGRVWLVDKATVLRGSYGNDKPGVGRLDGFLRKVAHPDLPPSALLVLALATLAIACVLGLSLLPRRSPYVRPDLFPSELVYAGYAGRVAAGTHPGMNLIWALLDYKRELEAELAHRLRLEGPFDPREAVRRAQHHGLDRKASGELDDLLKQLAGLSQAVEADSAPSQIGVSDLSNVVRKGEALLMRLETNGG
jgi:hypothetical protein